MKMKYLGVTAVLSVLTTVGAYAGPLTVGNVFVAGSGGTLVQYTQTGTFVQTLATQSTGFMTGMAFDGNGDLYATRFSDAKVNRYAQADGSLVGGSYFAATDASSSSESIVFDAAGNFYVGQADGTKDILQFAANGTLLARYDVATTARGSDWIDLAADQKTMYYTSENYEVKRYDVSTGTQLSDFATLATRPAYALRLLGDGGLLVADSVNITRLNSAGAVAQTYTNSLESGQWFALNLDPNGTSFWSARAGGAWVYEFDIATGNLLSSFQTNQQIYGLAVAGEITQATVPDGGATVVLLGLALVSLHRLRRR